MASGCDLAGKGREDVSEIVQIMSVRGQHMYPPIRGYDYKA
jgi:hypothetical protein